MRVIQAWSGGKDSTLSAYLHIERGDDVTLVCSVPYFNENIPLIGKDMLDFIYDKKYYFERLGAKVHIIRGMSYFDFCTNKITRGIRKGLLRGYPIPITGKCGFMSVAKKIPINNFLKNNAFCYDKMSISYTSEENRGALKENQMSLLKELGYTQEKVLKNALELNLLAPHYEKAKRDGCLLCYNAKTCERHKWFNENKGAFDLLYSLQEDIYNSRPDIYPLRNKHFFIEDSKFISPNGSNICMFGASIL